MKQLYQSLYVQGQISEQDFSDISAKGIKTIINNRPDNEEPGQPSHEEIAAIAAKQGIDYVYLPMVNGQPLPPSLVNDFKTVLDNTNDPVLVHCRSGMRSSFIWALGQIESGQLSPDEVIDAAQNANIPLANYRTVLESVVTG